MSFKDDGYFDKRPNGLSGKPMSSIRSILKGINDFPAYTEKDRENQIDQALKEIEEAIKKEVIGENEELGADGLTKAEGAGVNNLRQVQRVNLKELLK